MASYHSLITLALTTALIGGCIASDDDDDLNARHYTLHTATDTVSSEGVKTTRVLDNSWDYRSELSDYSNDSAASVDFNDYKVLLIDLGLRPSGGYAIRFDDVREEDDYVRVEYTLLTPSSDINCHYTSGYTNPFVFEAIEPRKEILVSESIGTNSCPPDTQ